MNNHYSRRAVNRLRASGASIGLVSLTAMLMASPALAQTNGSQVAGGDDIIVTAQRREESLQTVPVAVTALSAASLEERSLDSVNELSRSVPSLSIRPLPGDPSASNIALRGVQSADSVVTIDPAVGVYLDGVYIARSVGSNLRFFDVERVEVLRGPQGTLFGRNTIGGAINLIPKKPSDKFEAEVSASYGNYDYWRLDGVVNAPISDVLSARLTASHQERDGFARSTLTGVPLNDDNTDFVRGQVRLDLPDFEFLLSGDYSKTTLHNQWVTLNKVIPGGVLILEADLSDDGRLNGSQTADSIRAISGDRFARNIPSQSNGRFYAEAWGVSGAATANPADWLTVKWISAYRETKRGATNADLDGTPFTATQAVDQFQSQWQFSQEIQLLGSLADDRLDYILGGYFFTEEGQDLAVASFIPRVLSLRGPVFNNLTEGYAKNESLSAFAQFGYRLSDQLKLTAGIRHVKDTRELSLANRNVLPRASAPFYDTRPNEVLVCLTPGVAANNCLFKAPKGSFSYTPFTVGVDYTPRTGILVYGKFSRGFRSGGINLRSSAAAGLEPFNPESVDSYEVGIKSKLFDHLTLNLAAYNMIYSDIQIVTIVPLTGGGSTTSIKNSGEAKIDGIEAEATLRFGGLSINGSGSYTRARFTKLNPAVPATEVTLDSEFTLTPKWKASINADYRLELGTTKVNFHVGYDWQSRILWQLIPPKDVGNQQPARGLVNARISVNLENGMELSVWGDNLTDKKYAVGGLDSSSTGNLRHYPGDPRTYGVTAKYRF